jgi:hypothetical protein
VKFSAPIDARDTRKDVLEKSAVMIDSSLAHTVPLPTATRKGFSCLTCVPKFDPVCTTGDSWYPTPRK